MGNSTSLVALRNRAAIRGAGVSALAIALTGMAAIAQSPNAATALGRVSLDVPDLPPATVEIDLGRGLVRHALALTDAAVAGFLEGLMTSPDAESSENVQFVAQQLTSARELGDVVSEVIHEVHVRIWDKLPADSRHADKLAGHFDAHLAGEGWESAIRVRDGDSMVRILVHRDQDSLNGILIVAGEGNDLVLANIIGDVSPDNVQKLSSTATKIGVKLGLDGKINRALEQMKREIERKAH
jgi:hypothetical protein